MVDFIQQRKFEKRNHHYVPQFWQRHFRDEKEQLFKTYSKGVKTAATSSTMTGDWTYIDFDDFWRPGDAVEDQLSLWEAHASHLIIRIQPTNSLISDEDWKLLSLWLGICACRHPHVLDRYKVLAAQYAYDLALAGTYPDVQAMNLHLHNKYGVTIGEDDFQRILATPDEELIAQAIDIDTMPPFDPRLPNTEALLARNVVANAIYSMDQTVLDAPNGHEFILGSNPLPNQLLSQGFTIPLTKEVALNCSPSIGSTAPTRNRRAATFAEVGDINLEQIGRSTEAIASSKETLKYWVEKYDSL